MCVLLCLARIPGGDNLEGGVDVLLVQRQHRTMIDVQFDEILLQNRKSIQTTPGVTYICMYECMYYVYMRLEQIELL